VSPARRLLAGAVALWLTAACEDAPSTMVVFSRDDPWSFAQGEMARGGLPVVVRGRIGAVDGGPLADAVVAAMRQAMTWTATPDLRAVDRAAPEAMRVIVLFGAGGGPGGGPGACRGEPEGGTVAAGQPASMTMILCAGDERIAEVAGRFGRPSPPGEPAFARLIRRATGEMFQR
jgi:hypothetical protein